MELLDKGFNAENINKLTEEINDVLLNGINSTLKYGVDEMCQDTWRWQSGNPNGYAEGE